MSSTFACHLWSANKDREPLSLGGVCRQSSDNAQEQCHVEHRGADGNTSPKRAARSNPCCTCPKVCLISVNSCQPILSLEYHGKHTFIRDKHLYGAFSNMGHFMGCNSSFLIGNLILLFPCQTYGCNRRLIFFSKYFWEVHSHAFLSKMQHFTHKRMFLASYSRVMCQHFSKLQLPQAWQLHAHRVLCLPFL